MGVVWQAVDEVLGRDVAVKELRTYTDSSAPELAELTLRMQREARAAARVRHPGVVSVHDIAEHEGRPVIVMELVDGPSLADVLAERGTVDPREAARTGAKVLEALAAAHDAGVLHRDVKPGNILLDGAGRVVLTDFGIAAMEDPGDGSTAHLTRSGELVGSLDYLAPERAQGGRPGPASDVWALGATLYAAVEGTSPFRRTSTWSTLTAIVVEPLPEPRRAGPLGSLLQQLMHKDPAQRPDARTAARLLADFADPPGGAPEAAHAPDRPAAAAPQPAAQEPAGFGPAAHEPAGFGPAPFPPPSGAPTGGGSWPPVPGGTGPGAAGFAGTAAGAAAGAFGPVGAFPSDPAGGGSAAAGGPEGGGTAPGGPGGAVPGGFPSGAVAGGTVAGGTGYASGRKAPRLP
ncbi:serine/threonine-protein kinase [Streptomyces sp. CC228A]|uniref:serine/threonine-protein kinase n=1 Tax=Streptomyces sp. CC228A TaxID=2898186 RepID=UPI0035A94F1A